MPYKTSWGLFPALPILLTLSGCGLQHTAAPYHPPHSSASTTPASTGITPSSQSTASASPAVTPSPTTTITVQNAPPTQIESWAKQHILYILGPSNAYDVNPGGTIFLLPKAFHIPTTLHHWPSSRFQAVAVLTNPGIQLGTGTGTLWNQMTSSIYWLKPASSSVLPRTISASTDPSSVFTVPAGQLFAVPWPSSAYPERVLFLKPRHFKVPTEVNHWPSHNFRVVAVYPEKDLPGMSPWLNLARVIPEAAGLNARATPIPLSALPSALSNYAAVRNTVGKRLAQTADVPVYLPSHLLQGSYHGDLDVKYSEKNQGYSITIGAGPALPANSPKIEIGNAELLGTITAMPWYLPFHARQDDMPLYPAPPHTQGLSIPLAPGITGIQYTGTELIPTLITWHEDGWTMNFLGTGVSASIITGSAKSIAKSLVGAKLPGTHGRATFSIGSDAPSEASYDLHGTRYFIYANGFKAVTLAQQMTAVKPSS
ncbi:hypothetical protein [Sulfobacillus sp. hq2]|uniref:hypothetical protein n=1 Tax=Sulfobacillus sp. hq2 TaxID=2039167 RepID=UPI0011AF5D82|nr:hypothetical protein [Sulfobacillus sp. hq2]